MVSVPWVPTQDGKWGEGQVKGKFSNHNKRLQKRWGACPVFISFLHQTHFPSILSLSINTSDSTFASRGEDKHVHEELEMKDRNVIILLLLASFLFCFPKSQLGGNSKKFWGKRP